MKPLVLLACVACGTAASLCGDIVFAQAWPEAWSWPAAAQGRGQEWHSATREPVFVPPVPRGDLRADIENNARARFSAPGRSSVRWGRR